MYGDSERMRAGLGQGLMEPRAEMSQCPPRLCASDLGDPEAFHRRLVDWLMKQK